MAKPLLYTVPAFDAAMAQTFRFMYAGIITGTMARIAEHHGGAGEDIVYTSDIYTTQKAEFVLPANSVINSEGQYKIQVCVVDENGAQSTWSDWLFFYCRQTPVFEFVGLGRENTIQTSSLEVSLRYRSSDGEAIGEYTIYLYDQSLSEVQRSGAFYDTGSSYIVSNLINSNTQNNNGSVYYLRAQGVTEHGMVIDTGIITLVSGYDNKGEYAKVVATNQRDAGTISIRSYIVSIDGRVEGEYTFKDFGVNPVAGVAQDSRIIFDEGVRIGDDFYIGVLIPELTQINSAVVVLSEGKDECEVQVICRSIDGVRRVFAVLNAGQYTVHSGYVDRESGLGLKIFRIGGLYSIQLNKV